MDGRQSYEVIHKGGLMESETKTENYKNTSMPPSARLEENQKKESFSSAAAGSPSAVNTGPSSPGSAILAGSQPSVSQAGLNTHRQKRAGAAGGREAQPPAALLSGHRPLGCSGDGPSHHKGGSVIRDTRESAHGAPHRPPTLTPHTLLSANLPRHTVTQVLPACPRHDLKRTEGQSRGAGLLAPCPPWPVP